MTEHLGNFSEGTDEQLAEQERSFPSPHRIGDSMRAEMARREAVRRRQDAAMKRRQDPIKKIKNIRNRVVAGATVIATVGGMPPKRDTSE